jgi:predicted alpha/beta-fold hydrolase
MNLHGHCWTVAPRLRHALVPLAAPPSRAWETSLDDPVAGRVRLTGRFAPAGGSAERELLLAVHGLGGSTESHTAVRTARAAAAAGVACLRLNLRGSDRLGDDFYHAALTADLHAALASPELLPYARIYLLGWSLGGHLALRFAAEEADPRVAAVAAVCAPLDLAASVDAIDRPGLWAYRRSVLRGLKEIYAAGAARRPGALPVREAARIGRLREWDDRIVAPRHGFAGAADYYARASVAPLLPRLRVPALVLAAERDPMVPAATVRPVLQRLESNGGSERLEFRWLRRGGHCGFPVVLDIGGEGKRLGEEGEAGGGVERQVIGWLRRHG